MMRYTILIVTLLALAASAGWASFEEVQADGRSYGMAGTGVALAGEAVTTVANPALAASITGLRAQAGSCLPFGLRDLATLSTAAVTVRGRLGLGLGLNTLGGAIYREVSIRAVAAWRAHQLLSVGAALDGYQLAIESYGSSATWGAGLGLYGTPSPHLALGIAAWNLNRPSIGQAGSDIPRELSAGLAYQPSPGATTAIQLHSQEGWPLQVRLGQEYRFRGMLALRAGFSNPPAAISCGFGVSFRHYQLDYGVRTHPDLGLSQCLSFGGQIAGRDAAPETTVARPDSNDAKVDLNTAAIDRLLLLPGVGEATALTIIAYRDSAGQFQSLNDLANVGGMTRRRVERLAPFVRQELWPWQEKTVQPVDLNTAQADQLAELPDIGPKTAADIISYRLQHGPFKAIEEVMKVRGIGRKTFEKIRELITVSQ